MTRLLLVHAHPDDETLTTGTTMAHYAAAGHEVHVLTCTLGEEGEVIPAELAHLEATRDDTLGLVRREELREAMHRLGVAHAVLGEDEPAPGLPRSRYRDSGMAGMPSGRRRDAFAAADPDEAGGRVADHVRRLRPGVVVTYDEHGGYGHPDHVQVHRVTMRALGLLADDELPESTFQLVTPRQWAEEDRIWLRDNVPRSSGLTVPGGADPFPPSVVDDVRVTHSVIAPGLVDRQAWALAAHRTQVSVFDGYYALSNRVAARLAGREAFVRVDPRTGAALAPPGGAARGGPVARHTGLLGETGA